MNYKWLFCINPHTAHYILLTITAHWVIFTQINLKTTYLEFYLVNLKLFCLLVNKYFGLKPMEKIYKLVLCATKKIKHGTCFLKSYLFYSSLFFYYNCISCFLLKIAIVRELQLRGHISLEISKIQFSFFF